mmetsp:Transcript_5408/g.20189  ORF Transcript_5408/g.20189 Transcript_5408/m.20189 type:complete len:407 (-) Transcript_5408:57-1277(-)
MSRPPSNSLYIGNLGNDITQSQLNSFLHPIIQQFAPHGAQSPHIRLITDPQTQQAKGFAFIDFESVNEASEVMDGLRDIKWEGRRLRVNYSEGTMRGNDNANQQNQMGGGFMGGSGSGGMHQMSGGAFMGGGPPQHQQMGMMPGMPQMAPPPQYQIPPMPGHPFQGMMPMSGGPPPQMALPPQQLHQQALPINGSYYPSKRPEDDIMRILMKLPPQRLTHILSELSAHIRENRSESSEMLAKNPNFCITVLHMLYLLDLLRVVAPQSGTAVPQMGMSGAEPPQQQPQGPVDPRLMDPRLIKQEDNQNAGGDQQQQQSQNVYHAPGAIQQPQQHAPQQQAPPSQPPSISPDIQARLNEYVDKLSQQQLQTILGLSQESVDKLPSNQQNQIGFIRMHAEYLSRHIVKR